MQTGQKNTLLATLLLTFVVATVTPSCSSEDSVATTGDIADLLFGDSTGDTATLDVPYTDLKEDNHGLTDLTADLPDETVGPDTLLDLEDSGFLDDTQLDTVADVPLDIAINDTWDAVEDLASDSLPDIEVEEDTVEQPTQLWPNEWIQDPSTAQCTFSNHHTTLKDGVLVDAWEVTYFSWESIDGTLTPILIRAFASKPVASASSIPGIVQAHGLGGYAEESHATGLAALTGAFVIAYTGPGGGTEANNTSEGRASGYDNGYRMFDVLVDPRGSWFWGHAVAAMRGITCLETRDEVDPQRIGMTGFSAGGVATLLVSGADPRVVASVPLSASLAWNIAVEAPKAWQHALLEKAGLSTTSAEWQTLMNELILPTVALSQTNTQILMVNGTTDEFFPLTAHVETYNAIPGTDKRTSLAANFDHGCYGITGVESAANIEERAEIRSKGGQRMWFAHWFGTDATYSYVPAAPVVTVQGLGPATIVGAQVDSGGSQLDVENVHIWWSSDNAAIFGSLEMDDNGGGLYSATLPFTLPPNVVYYVDVQYKKSGLLSSQRFSISSVPVIPANFIPDIRAVDSCM